MSDIKIRIARRLLWVKGWNILSKQNNECGAEEKNLPSRILLLWKKLNYFILLARSLSNFYLTLNLLLVFLIDDLRHSDCQYTILYFGSDFFLYDVIRQFVGLLIV